MKTPDFLKKFALSKHLSAAVVFSMLSLLTGCDTNTYHVHYKLTLSVRDGETIKTGFSVVGLSFSQNTLLPGFDATGHWNYGAEGEATIVDLGNKGLLIATFAVDPARPKAPYEPWAWVFQFFPGWFHNYASTPDIGEKGVAEIKAINKDKPSTNVPIQLLPFLVRFRDVNDPASVERVDPYNLAKTFGAGVQFVDATVAVTDEPITKHIDSIFKWITPLQPGQLLNMSYAGRHVSDIPPEYMLEVYQLRRAF